MPPKEDEAELASVSTRLDGRASIEHQIDIHVLDLVQLETIPEFSLDDILQGLKYVMDYRIKGLKMKNLDLDLMKRLLESLLHYMAGKEGSLLKQKSTKEADLAFHLFGQFLLEVEEFRVAVSEKTATDLRHALKIHRRCQPRSKPEEKEFAASILAILTRNFPQFSDWKDLVKEREYGDVEAVIKEYHDKYFSDSTSSTSAILPSGKVSTLYPPQALYFDKNADKLEPMYGTDFKNGLSASKVKELESHYGKNKLPEPPKASILKMLITQITDFIVMVLIAVTILQFATNAFAEGVVLLIVVVLNVIIGFTQEYKATKALEALTSLVVSKATVIRDGKQEQIDAETLVPGDIVILDEGDAVPADLRLFESSQLEVVEAILTGESVPSEKSTKCIRKRTRKIPLGDCRGNTFMSTVVAKGRGKGVVVRIGDSTEIGKISKAITSQPHQQTRIQRNISHLGKWLIVVAVILCALVVVIGVAWGNEAIGLLKVGVGLAVSVIPEGLVAVVTVTMAIGVKKMSKSNAIVRQLPSVESLGSVQVICSDKTGTLTEGKMGTAQIWTADNSLYNFSESTSLDPSVGQANKFVSPKLADALAEVDAGKKPKIDTQTSPTFVSKEFSDAPYSLVASSMVASLCNNSSVIKDESEGWKPIGDPTEVAMVVASQKAGFSKDFFENQIGLERIGEYPFDSERKLMSVLYKQSGSQKVSAGFDSPDSCFVLVKGAPERVLSRSTRYLAPDEASTFGSFVQNQAQPMTDNFQELVSTRASEMAESGLRVLAFAIRNVDSNQARDICSSKKNTESETDLTFVCLIGLIDPPKAGVADSITTCRNAGIKVVMITGDHVSTACAIAKQLGIYDPNTPERSARMQGYEIDLLSEEALAEMRPFPVVFARVSPDNKLKIVRALQSKKLSVAMTGDGVNDAPAIKRADVGVAMGIGGTEITRQAADIVLADDNFTTIVKAVREGRRVFDNIKKFIVYLLSCNSAEILLFLLAACLDLPLPFTVKQILWANIIADVPPAMSLGVEPFELDIMDRPPRPTSEGVLTVLSSCIIAYQGLVQALVTFGVYIMAGANSTREIIDPSTQFLKPIYDELPEQQTLAFLVLTMMQLFQSFLSRSVTKSVFETGVLGNKWMVFAFILSTVLFAMSIYVPGFNQFLGNTTLPGISWVIALISLVIQIVLVEVMKVFARSVETKQQKRVTTSFSV